MSSDVRVLIIDSDTSASQKLGLALDSAGLAVTWCSFSPTDVIDAVRDFNPSVLLVRSEIASPQLAALLVRVEGKPLPVVLLCKDTSEQRFTKAWRTGVVELFAEPFNGRAHVAKIRGLPDDLSSRTGELLGRGNRELNEALAHFMRTRRTGALEVGDEGVAYFQRGVLRAAQMRDLSGQPALGAMVREDTTWVFTEGKEPSADELAALTEAPAAQKTTGKVPSHSPLMSNVHSAPSTRQSATSLPMVSSAPPSAAVHASTSADTDAAKTPILFVDDDAAVLQLLSSYFMKKGYPVSTANDGVEAIQLMTTRPFEVVIADLNMPRMDGWGFLRLAREDLRTHETPVALFSAHDGYRDQLRLTQAGAQAYFPKTMRMAALEVQIKELCEPRRRFIRLIDTEGGIEFDFGKLGPQWSMKALTINGFSGQIDARDEWANWTIWFEKGRLVQCTARMGPTLLSSDQALGSFLTSRHAEGGLNRGIQAPDEGFSGQSTAQVLARLVPWLNDEQKRAAESQLSRARALTVNTELYRLFQTVGPPAWQPMVKLLCEDRLAPAQVIAQLRVTPLEVATVVKELLRRGVASLAA
jgi:DNA-binding response OmpR family regulator